MNKGFSQLRLEDGCITEIRHQGAELHLTFKNWQDEEQPLVFHDVIGFEVLGALDTDLSHGTETTSDPFLDKACATDGERPGEYLCFTFVSAWSDCPILKVIARGWEEKAKGETKGDIYDCL